MSTRTLSQRILSADVYNKRKAIVLKGSVAFGASGSLTVPASSLWVFTGDHTIEAWVYTSSSGDQHIFGGGGAGTSDQFGISAGSGSARMYYCYGSVGYLTSTGTIPSNTWTHVAVCRSGTTLRGFINGVQIGSGTVTGTIGANATNYIGRRSDGNNQFSGNISNLRVTTTALYTSGFTVPTFALSATGAALLTCHHPDKVIDTSSNNFTITVNSPAAASSSSPF